MRCSLCWWCLRCELFRWRGKKQVCTESWCQTVEVKTRVSWSFWMMVRMMIFITHTHCLLWIIKSSGPRLWLAEPCSKMLLHLCCLATTPRLKNCLFCVDAYLVLCLFYHETIKTIYIWYSVCNTVYNMFYFHCKIWLKHTCWTAKTCFSSLLFKENLGIIVQNINRLKVCFCLPVCVCIVLNCLVRSNRRSSASHCCYGYLFRQIQVFVYSKWKTSHYCGYWNVVLKE